MLALALTLAGCQATDVPAGQPAPEPSAATASTTASSSEALPTPSASTTGGPTGSPTGQPTGTPSPSGRPSPDDPIDQVLAVSVDALNPDAITELGPAKTPTFHRLMREGAWTLNARTEQELTITLPNHTGMLTGRRVAKKDGGHGVTFNVDDGTTVHRTAGEYVSSVFDVVHDHGGQTALFSAKEKFAFFARTWNAAGAPDRVGVDNGRKKIDRVVLDTDNARLIRTLDADLLTTSRAFTFLHISLPDVAGHAHGFMGKDYLEAVEQTDTLLGRVLATIQSRPATAGHLLLVVTADHGGLGPNHIDPTKLADYRIPFLAWGPGVPKDSDLYVMNPTFVDPRGSRPGYTGRQPIRNGDVANLVTDVLDLPTVPGSALDRPRTLTVFD
jgi:hypothetical protein